MHWVFESGSCYRIPAILNDASRHENFNILIVPIFWQFFFETIFWNKDKIEPHISGAKAGWIKGWKFGWFVYIFRTGHACVAYSSVKIASSELLILNLQLPLWCFQPFKNTFLYFHYSSTTHLLMPNFFQIERFQFNISRHCVVLYTMKYSRILNSKIC